MPNYTSISLSIWVLGPARRAGPNSIGNNIFSDSEGLGVSWFRVRFLVRGHAYPCLVNEATMTYGTIGGRAPAMGRKRSVDQDTSLCIAGE